MPITHFFCDLQFDIWRRLGADSPKKSIWTIDSVWYSLCAEQTTIFAIIKMVKKNLNDAQHISFFCRANTTKNRNSHRCYCCTLIDKHKNATTSDEVEKVYHSKSGHMPRLLWHFQFTGVCCWYTANVFVWDNSNCWCRWYAMAFLI